MKKTTKKINKPVKLDYIVDLTDIKDINDIYVRYGLAKQRAGYPISYAELDAIVSLVTAIAFKTIEESLVKNSKAIEITGDEKLLFGSDGNCSIITKKPNIFRRFWNWMTRKK